MKEVVASCARIPGVRVDRRDGRHRARRDQRRARLRRAGREAQGAQRVHPHLGPVRRRGRFRQGDARSGDRRAAPEFVPDSTTGGPGDKLHPNRAGYLAMGMAIDLDLLRRNSRRAGDSPLLRPRSLSPATQRVLGKHSQLALAHVAHQKLHL